jgi:hypothetical protein
VGTKAPHNVAMPVAPGMVQRMPHRFSRCPVIDLHPASASQEPVRGVVLAPVTGSPLPWLAQPAFAQYLCYGI